MADLSITTEIVGLNAITSGMAGITKSVETMRQSAERAAQSLSDFGQSMSLKVTTPLTLIGKASIDAEAQMNKLNVMFKTATGSAESAGKELDFVRKVADQMGIPFAEAAEQFGRLLTSSDSMSKNLPQARAVFVGFSEALRATGASSSQIALSFNALSQMSSKGRVTLEELGQQLGDHLPGALRFAAQGMGVTTGKLLEMIQKGEILPDVLLPRMANALHKTFGEGAKEASELWPAVFSRFRNSLFALEVIIGESGLSDFMISITKSATDAINWLTRLDEPTRRFLVTVGGIAAAAGPAALVLGQTLKVLLAMASPFALAATAAAALVTAFNGWDEVGEVIAGVGRSVADFAVATGKNLGQALTAFRSFAGEVKAAFDAGGVSAALDVILVGLTNLASSARDKLSTLGADIYEAVRGQLETIGPRIGPAAQDIGRWIAEAIPKGISALADLGGKLLASIGIEVDNLQGSLLALGGKIGEWLIAGVPALLLGKGIGTLTTRMVAWLEAEIGAIEVVIPRLSGEIGKWIADGIPKGFAAVSTFGADAAAAIGSSLESARQTIVAVAGPVAEWIAEGVTNGLSRLADMGSAVTSWVAGWKIDSATMDAMGAKVGASIGSSVGGAIERQEDLGPTMAAWVEKGGSSGQLSAAVAKIADVFKGLGLFVSNVLDGATAPLRDALMRWVDAGAAAFGASAGSFGLTIGRTVAGLIAVAFESSGGDSRVTSAVTNTFKGVIEFAGGVIVPIMQELTPRFVAGFAAVMASFQADAGPKLREALESLSTGNSGTMQKLGAAVSDGLRGIPIVVGEVVGALTGVDRNVAIIGASITAAVAGIVLAVKGMSVITGLATTVVTAFGSIGGVVAGVVKTLATVATFLTGPWGAALLAAGAGIALFVKAFGLFDTIAGYVDGARQAIGTFTSDVAAALKAPTISASIDGIVTAFSALGTRALAGLSTFGADILAKIKEQIASAMPEVTISGEDIGKAIAQGLIAAIKLVAGLGKAVVDWISAQLSAPDAGTGIRAALTTFANLFDALAGFVVNVLKGFGAEIWKEISAQMVPLKTQVDKAIDDYIVAPFKGLIDKIKASWAGIKAGVDNLIEENIIAPLRALEGKVRNALPTPVGDMILGPAEIKKLEDNAKKIEPAIVGPITQAGVRIQTTTEQVRKNIEAGLGDIPLLFGNMADGAIAESERLSKELVTQSIYPEMMDAIVGVVESGMEEVTKISGGAADDMLVDWAKLEADLPKLAASGLGKTTDEFKKFGQTLEGIVNSPILGLEQKITQLERLQDRAATAGKTGVAAIDNIQRALADLYVDAAKNDIKGVIDGTTASWQDQIEALVVASQRYQAAGETGQKAVKSIADEVEKLLDLNLADFGTELGGAWTAQIAEIDRTIVAIGGLKEAGKEAGQALVDLRERVITAWANDEIEKVMSSTTITIDEQKAALAQLAEQYAQFGEQGKAGVLAVRQAQEDLARQTPTILEGMKQGWVGYYNDVTNLGKSAADATAQGLRTVESTLSEFFKTGKLNFTSLKEFAIQTYADMAAQATMSMVVQSGKAFKDWLFGAQTDAKGVQTAVEGSMTGAATATAGFGTQAQGVFSGLWEFVTAGFSGMLASITSILGGLLTFFTDLLTQIGGLFSSLWASIVEGASSLMGSLGGILGGLGSTVGGVVDTVGGLFSGLWDTITTAGSGAMSLIGGAIDLFGGNSASVMDTVSTGWSSLFGGMGTTATDTLGVVNSGIDFTGITFGETMGGMSIASDATFEGIGAAADYTFTGINGGVLTMDGTFTDAMGNILSSGSQGFSTLSANSLASLGTISSGIALVANGAQLFFNDLGTRANGAIGAIGGVATALASLAAGNPLGVIAGAVGALNAAASFFSSSHDNYSVDIKNGQLSTGTNTNPNPQNQATAERVAKEVNDFLQQRGITDRAEVKVDDRGTVISLYGKNDFQRTDNDPNKALQQFKSHIINQGLAEGGLVVNGIPFAIPGSRDNLLAPLRQGEFVVREEATRQFHPLLDAINRGQVTARTLGGLARAGMGMPGATVGPNVVVRFFDELDGAWKTLAEQADSAFGDVTSTVEQWRETGAAKVAEFAESSKAHLEELAPKSVEVFAGMGETLRLWAEDGSTRLAEFVTATGERLGELVPLTGETMRVMGETLVTWIDDGLRGWDTYATGVTASHDLVADHHAMRAEEMGLGWSAMTTRMGADQARLEAATTASYRAVGAYATTTLAAINTAFAAMVAAAVARLAQLRAEAGATIAAINGEVASAEANIARARAEAASIPAPGGGYDKDRGFATGGDAVFTSPTRIMVGEQGPERISARPLGRGRTGGSGQTLVFQGPVIANDLSMTQLARRLMREVEREQQRRR